MRILLSVVLLCSLALDTFAEETVTYTGSGALNDPIATHSTTASTITSNGSQTTKIEQPPPSAIAPQFSAGTNSDLCTIGVAGAVQTQILGISAGTTFTEENCIRLKNAKTMYDMGMKVAAVSIMCQDQKVFDAMLHAGTPCPYNGQIGEAALAAVLMIGPRKGKYDKNGKPKHIAGSNTGQVALGMLILWMGWFGFNGGSQLSILGNENADAVAQIFVNTNTAAAAGLIVAMILAKVFTGKTALNATVNGALAGLVVITADPLTPSAEMAALYGALGGLIVVPSMVLLEKWGIDDPVGAISVHGVAGILGLMLVPVLNADATLTAQFIGTIAIFVFVFVASLVVWTILKYTIGIRVGEEEELAGSDLWEGTGTAYPDFMKN